MTEIQLSDSILRLALDLQRVSANDEAQAVQILTDLESELKQLLASGNLSTLAKSQVTQLINDAETIISGGYAKAGNVVDLQGVVSAVADNTATAMQAVLNAAVVAPSAETLASLSKSILIDGSPAKAWWARQSEDTAFRFAAAVRQGVANGETNERIVARIAGKSGFMEVARSNARTLVHSSIMTAANDARMATYRKNGKYADGVRWLSTLDSSTCWTGETLILMADGSKRAISEIIEGDCVIGGVSGESHRVIATMKRLAQSSVVIHCDGHYVGQATAEHPILTPSGWREIGSFNLSADVSEREVLCRHYQASERAVSGARQESDGRASPCAERGMEEAREASDEDYRQGDKLRDSVRNGDSPDRAPEHQSAERLQHDGRRGRADWSGSHSRMDREGGHPQSSKSAGSGFPANQSSADHLSLDGSGAASQDERGAGCCPSGTAGFKSGMGECAQREGGRRDAGEVAGSGVSGEDGCKEVACNIGGDAQACGCEANGDHDAGEAFGISPEVLGHSESVSIGILSGASHVGEVEVFNLTIEGDHTFVAGGIITHNCLRCSALDGACWDFDGRPIKGNTIKYVGLPPAHFSCRCVVSLIPKSLDSVLGTTGLDAQIAANSQRASKDGPIANTGFDAFLARQTPEFIAKTLGKTRADMFTAGKLTLRQLVSGTGRPLTLKELAAR